jgi:hypothetical protein
MSRRRRTPANVVSLALSRDRLRRRLRRVGLRRHKADRQSIERGRDDVAGVDHGEAVHVDDATLGEASSLILNAGDDADAASGQMTGISGRHLDDHDLALARVDLAEISLGDGGDPRGAGVEIGHGTARGILFAFRRCSGAREVPSVFNPKSPKLIFGSVLISNPGAY